MRTNTLAESREKPSKKAHPSEEEEVWRRTCLLFNIDSKKKLLHGEVDKFDVLYLLNFPSNQTTASSHNVDHCSHGTAIQGFIDIFDR